MASLALQMFKIIRFVINSAFEQARVESFVNTQARVVITTLQLIHYLCMGPIGLSICNWQAFPAKGSVKI